MAALDKKLRGAEPQALDGRTALDILDARAREAQDLLARHAEAGPDVLHYLATHGGAATRSAVAANPGASAITNRLLADDAETEVRQELAVKIARLMPGLSREENAHIFALTIETLEKLARDTAVTVRAILAEEIKALTCVPHDVVMRLALDAENAVAEPILEYSPLLSDADLLEVIAGGQAEAALAAVARRKPVSETVSDAVALSLDVPAIASLLTNPDAAIRKETLDRVIEQAESVSEWHTPLVLRADLSARAIRRIAGFVGSSLIEKLAARHDLSEATQAHLSRQLRARLVEDDVTMVGPTPGSRATDLLNRARAEGRLDGLFLEQAAQSGNRELVVLALAELAAAPVAAVRRILAAPNPKPVVALVWHAHLPMRAAFKIQSGVMRLPAHELLPARGGTGFPLTKEEMRWHLAYYGIPT